MRGAGVSLVSVGIFSWGEGSRPEDTGLQVAGPWRSTCCTQGHRGRPRDAPSAAPPMWLHPEAPECCRSTWAACALRRGPRVVVPRQPQVLREHALRIARVLAGLVRSSTPRCGCGTCRTRNKRATTGAAAQGVSRPRSATFLARATRRRRRAQRGVSCNVLESAVRVVRPGVPPGATTIPNPGQRLDFERFSSTRSSTTSPRRPPSCAWSLRTCQCDQLHPGRWAISTRLDYAATTPLVGHQSSNDHYLRA